MSNVVIDIAAQFTGKPAFKKADTAVSQLNKTTQNLGKTLTRTFGTAAVLAFGRASIKAFTEDDKAATSLGQTLKNLNLAYGSNIGTVNGFISRLEEETGVLDDELRPAMDRLLRATSNVAKSQELLGLALDIAAGTGKTVTQVSQSLQKAYLGQNQALGRLGVGLTKAELASGSFEDIQQKLTALFAGQASAAAETYAGQLDKLTIAANNAKETIGKGLVEAIIAATGGSTVSATGNIQKLAQGIGDTVKNVGLLIGKLGDLKPVLIAVGLAAAAAFLPLTTAIAGAIFLLGDLNKRLDEQSFRKGIIPKGMGNISMTVSGQVDNRVLKNQKSVTKLTKEQAAAQAKILKDKQLAAAIDKAQALLGKSEETFDIEAIQLNAAQINQAELLGKATSAAQLIAIANDTQRLRLKEAMYQLERAIASNDQATIVAATERLNKELSLYGALTGQEVKLKDIKTVLESLTAKKLIDIDNLDEAMKKLEALGTTIANPFAAVTDGALAAANALNGLSGSFNSTSAASVDLTNKVAQMSFQQGIAAGNSLAESISGARYAAQAAAMMENPFENFSSSLTFAANAAKHLIEQVKLTGSVAQASFQQGIAAANSLAASISGARYAAQAAAAAGMGYVSTNTNLSAVTDTTAAVTTATNNATSDVNITVNTGIGDPNAIAEAIEEVLNNAINRGTLVGGVFAI